jgi:muramoyltetrapeptide carboxypeptidase
MNRPQALKSGATIGVVAPASPANQESFMQGVHELEGLGFRVKYSDSVFDRQIYFAGSHAWRAGNLLEMFADPEVDAIICARGGYGCHYLLPLLEPANIRSHPKIFMGYSDTTVLLQFLEQQCEMNCFHGPMVSFEFSRGEEAYDRQVFWDCLTRTSPGQIIASRDFEVLRGGSAEGILSGGCLSLLTALQGTPYEPRTEGRILFLEDIDAKPYQVDRMMMQLKLGGKLEKIHGIIFGEMMGCLPSSDQPFRLQDILFDILKDYHFPILFGVPSGHARQGMLTLPFGIRVRMDAEARSLEFLEGAVS